MIVQIIAIFIIIKAFFFQNNSKQKHKQNCQHCSDCKYQVDSWRSYIYYILYTLGVNLTKKMKNTRTRVKTKVYEMQLKLDRNQNIVGYSKDEDLRFHIERIQFAYIYLNIMCLFFYLNFTLVYLIN